MCDKVYVILIGSILAKDDGKQNLEKVVRFINDYFLEYVIVWKKCNRMWRCVYKSKTYRLFATMVPFAAEMIKMIHSFERLELDFAKLIYDMKKLKSEHQIEKFFMAFKTTILLSLSRIYIIVQRRHWLNPFHPLIVETEDEKIASFQILPWYERNFQKLIMFIRRKLEECDGYVDCVVLALTKIEDKKRQALFPKLPKCHIF